MATKSQVTLGQYGGGDYALDVPTLIDSRMLINASSGAGKSWLLRRIIELVANMVQVIVIDPEGEFASLREKFDMLLVGKGGEIEPEIRTARALARKLAELRVSAIVDLYDIGDWDARRAYLAPFLDGLMTLPKSQYHSILVAIDEAHQFAPEASGGRADSPVFASRAAVRFAMSAGRKRAICLALATQRISKMDKDSIADAKNVFTGGTTLDIDQKRAADILGFSTREQRLVLRDLKPGEFWGFGPALPRGVNNFFVDKVITTHPKAGQRHMLEVPPASGAIKAIVASLADLPQKAVEDANELEAARREIKRLQAENAEARAELGAWMAEQSSAAPAEVRVPVIEPEMLKTLEMAVDRAWEIADDLTQAQAAAIVAGDKLTTLAIEYGRGRDEMSKALKDVQAMLAGAPVAAGNGRAPYPKLPLKAAQYPVAVSGGGGGYSPGGIATWTGVEADAKAIGASGANLNKAARAVLSVLAQRGPRTRYQIAIQTGYAIKGGAFIQTLKSLADLGYTVKDAADTIEITPAGRKALGPVDHLPHGPALRDYWLGHSALTAVARNILAVLIENNPTAYTTEILAEYAAAKAGKGEPYAHKGGAFIDAVRKLRGLGLIEDAGKRHIRASAELF